MYVMIGRSWMRNWPPEYWMASPSCGTANPLYDDFMNCTSYSLVRGSAASHRRAVVLVRPLGVQASPSSSKTSSRQAHSARNAASGQAENNNITIVPAHPGHA